jgi:DNA-binding transcriptional LysR family regulator
MIDRLTLDQLRVLVAVAETGSFSAAGRRLGRVQSAISQSVQSLEAITGIALFDRSAKIPVLTEAGRVLLADARHLLLGAETLKARAQSIAFEVEPELSFAVDAVLPNVALMPSLKGLSELFPHLPVTLFTEGLGGAEQRLREGTARFAIYPPLPGETRDLELEFLAGIPMIPVVATTHALASEPGPLTRGVLEQHVQLVLTDRTQLSAGFSGNIMSVKVWRFADLGARLEFLLAGFGWCYMPTHLVETHIAEGRLKQLDIKEHRGRAFEFPLHVVHRRGAVPGRAGRWLIDDLRKRIPSCAASQASAA